MHEPASPLQVPDEFQIALRAGRLLRGYTLADVARATGIPGWRLSSVERGIAKLDPDEFGAIWRFLSSDRRRKEDTERGG